MDRFRGLVQRFGVTGGSGGRTGDNGAGGGTGSGNASSSTDLETLLPLTTTFVSQTLPRPAIRELSSHNNALANTAKSLLTRIDGLLDTHTSSASELRTLLTTIPTLRRSIDDTANVAAGIQKQLVELEEMMLNVQADELKVFEREEEERFEHYARERRKKLQEMKRGYDEKLDEFWRERVGVLAAEDIEGRERRLRELVAEAKEREVNEVRESLEKVSLEHGEEAGGALEGFFGDEQPKLTKQQSEQPGGATAASPVEKPSAKMLAKKKPRASGSKLPPPPPPPKNPVIMADEDLDPEDFDYNKL